MRILIIALFLISTFPVFSQENTTTPARVEKSPEKDGTTDRAPIDEGGGPGNDDKKPNAFQRIANQATIEKPFQVKIETLKSLKLRDGKSIQPADIKELSLNEERKIETVELKDNEIIHRLDVDTAVVKPNPVLPHVVTINPEKVEFSVQNKNETRAEMIRRLMLRGSETNNEVPTHVDFSRLPIMGVGALGGSSLMRVMGVDGGGRTWVDDTESGIDATPFRVKIGVDGGGITR